MVLRPSIQGPTTSSATGTIIAHGAPADVRSGRIRLAGTWVGTALVQASPDGTTYYTVPVWDVTSASPSKATSMTANGTYAFNVTDLYLKVTWTRTSGSIVGTLTTHGESLPEPGASGSSTISAFPASSTLSTWKTVSVDTTATGTELVAANSARKLLLVVNNGSTACYVGFGSVASGAGASATGGLLLSANGGALTLDSAMVTSQIKAITAASSTIVFVGEG